MSTYTNIPTIGIYGIQFRSRIEAKWAEMFTKLGWVWEYEPFDLKGYIPDFIIKFPHKHLLVEVKGDTDTKNIEQYADKIIKSGWEGEFLLVCSALDSTAEGIYLGLLGATQINYMTKTFPSDEYKEPCCPTIKNGDFAYLTVCDDCKKYTIYNDVYGWFCRNCGSGDSNKSLLYNRITKTKEERIPIELCINCKKYSDGLPNVTIAEAFGLMRRLCKCKYEYGVLFNKIQKMWVDAANNVQWKKPNR